MNASHHFIYCSNGSDFVMSRQLWAGAVPSVQAGGRVNTQPNPLSPRCSKVPRVPETKGRLSSVRCDETQRDCRAVLPPRPRRTALSKQCCILHSAGSQAIEKTTSRSSEAQKCKTSDACAARLTGVMTGLIMQAKRTGHLICRETMEMAR
jgi:hypothetical protein